MKLGGAGVCGAGKCTVMSCCALLTEMTLYGMSQMIGLRVLLREGSMMVFSQPDSGWQDALTN